MKLNLHQSILLRNIALGVFYLWIFSCTAVTGNLTTVVKNATIDDVNSFFKSQKKGLPAPINFGGAAAEAFKHQ